MTMIPRIGSRFSVPSSWYPVPLKCCPFTCVCVDPCGFSEGACCHPSCCAPGVSRTNLVKFRSSTGSSVSSLVSKRDDTSARSVFRIGENPSTVTASVTCADLQLDVECRLRVDVHADVRVDRLLEPGELDLHLVRTGQQALLDVVASFVGHDRVGRLALDAGDSDRHSGQQAARLVHHSTGNTAVNCLRRSAARQSCERDQHA